MYHDVSRSDRAKRSKWKNVTRMLWTGPTWVELRTINIANSIDWVGWQPSWEPGIGNQHKRMGNQEYWVGNLEHPRTLKPEPHPSTLSPTGLGSGSIWSICAACCCHWFCRFNRGIQSYSPPWRWGMTFWQALHMTSEHGTLPSGFLDFTIPRQPAQNIQNGHCFPLQAHPKCRCVAGTCGNICTIQPLCQ